MSPFFHNRPRVLMLAAAAPIALAALIAARDAATDVARAQSPPPAYDDFAERDYWYPNYETSADVFPVNREYDTSGATIEDGESNPCSKIGSTIWAEYRADRDGTVTLEADGSGFDAVLGVYTWDLSGGFIPSPPGAMLVGLVCDFAHGGPASVTFPITQDTQYLIQVGSNSSESGSVRLHGRCDDCTAPNDDFNRRTGIHADAYRPDATWTSIVHKATLEPREPQPCGAIDGSVWYEFYADLDVTYHIDTEGSAFDPVVALYRIDEYPEQPSALPDATCAGTDGRISVQGSSLDSRLHFIQVGLRPGDSGQLLVHLRCDPICPPWNDTVERYGFFDPLPGQERINTDGATTSAEEPRPCGDIGKTVWYAFEVQGASTVKVSTEGSDFDTVVAVYDQGMFSDPPVGLRAVACDAASSGGHAETIVRAEGLRWYWVQAGGRSGDAGFLQISVDCEPSPCPPYWDDTSRPASFSMPGSGPIVLEADTRGATTQPGEQLDCGPMGHTVWLQVYPWQGAPVPLFFETTGSDFDTAIAVYKFPYYELPLADFERVACAPGGAGVSARVDFVAEPGTSYLVQFGGRGVAGGSLRISGGCVSVCPPENDNIDHAYWLYPPAWYWIDTRSATLEPGEQQPCGPVDKTVWYRLESVPAGDYRITTEGSDFPTSIGVFVVEGISPPGGFRSLACTEASSALTFTTRAGGSYYIQVGGRGGASGMLQTFVECIAGCNPTSPPGGAIPLAGAGVSGPDTGSGGYLSRRR